MFNLNSLLTKTTGGYDYLNKNAINSLNPSFYSNLTIAIYNYGRSAIQLDTNQEYIPKLLIDLYLKYKAPGFRKELVNEGKLQTVLSRGFQNINSNNYRYLTEVLDFLDEKYNLEDESNLFVDKLPISGDKTSYVSNANRIDAILNNNKVTIATKEDEIISNFHYQRDDRLLFTLVVHKDNIIRYKKDYHKGIISTDTVELWVDKEFINTDSRRIFDKFLRELVLSLLMKGVKVVEKDNILLEFYKVELNLNSPDKINTFKRNLNKMFKDELQGS